MAEKRIIAVVGATGAQGGGLVRAILSDPKGGFGARALTRDVNSDKAKALAKLGAEVVAADVDDLESPKRAFEGAYGAFCVTFFWEHFSPEKELAEAANMAQAAKQAGIEHVIWSTLEDTRKWVPLSDNRMPTLMGKYKVPHLDAKGEANHLFTDLGLPVTFLQTSFYWDNFIYFGMGPKKGPDGKLALTMPMGDKKLPGIAAEDIGRCAYGIFKRGREFIGKTRRWPPRSPRRWVRRCATTTCHPRCTAVLVSRAPRTSATCSSSSATSTSTSVACATSMLPEPSTPRCKVSTRGSPKTRPIFR
jgi:uncharacterized protein YbjT (DUF2867 family)